MFVIQVLYIIVMFVVSYLCFIQIFTSVATHRHRPSISIKKLKKASTALDALASTPAPAYHRRNAR
jgi:hypothetical protein